MVSRDESWTFLKRKRDFEFEAKIDFQEGLMKTIDWYRHYREELSK